MADADPPNDTEEAIRRRAHVIWEQEGRPEGQHEDHWRRARQEVTGLSEDAAPWVPGDADAQSYGRNEQPTPSDPDPDSGVAAATDQAGEAVPKPSQPTDIPGKPTGARALPKSRKPRG